MHVCHTIDNMHPDRGGPVAVVAGLAGAQVAAGDEVTVVCRRQLRPGEARSVAHALPRGVRLVETGALGADGVSASLDEVRPDVIHIHGVWEPYHRWCAAWARRHGVPWVLSSHGMLHPVPMRKGWLKKRLYLSLRGGAVTRARRLLVTSNEEAEFAARLTGVDTVVLVNGVDPAEYAAVDRSAFSSSHPEFGGRPYLLFLGRIHEIKGIDGLVRAYALACGRGLEGDLVLAGPADGAEASVASLASGLGMSARIHLVGPVYGQSKAEVLAGCALFVHRPRYEGFGMTVVEAMAAGRPALTTMACGVARECPQGVLEVAGDSDSAFADAMVRLCSPGSRSYTESLATRGREWVVRELSWAAIARRAAVLYR